MSKLTSLAQRVTELLAGEPARFIFYGAALVIWAITGVANALGYDTLGPAVTLEDALVQATIAGAILTEFIRRYVYAPRTVQVVASEAFSAGLGEGARAQLPAEVVAALPDGEIDS